MMNNIRIVSVNQVLDEIEDFVMADKALEKLRMQGAIMEELDIIFNGRGSK